MPRPLHRPIPAEHADRRVELVEMAGDSIIKRLGEMSYAEGLEEIAAHRRPRRDLQMLWVESGRFASWTLKR
jgi:hypothetical protein